MILNPHFWIGAAHGSVVTAVGAVLARAIWKGWQKPDVEFDPASARVSESGEIQAVEKCDYGDAPVRATVTFSGVESCGCGTIDGEYLLRKAPPFDRNAYEGTFIALYEDCAEQRAKHWDEARAVDPRYSMGELGMPD